MEKKTTLGVCSKVMVEVVPFQLINEAQFEQWTW